MFEPIDLHFCPFTLVFSSPYPNHLLQFACITKRSLREYEYGGPLPEKNEANSTANVAATNKARDGSGESKKEIPLPGVTLRPEYSEETPEDFEIPSKRYLQYAPPSWYGTDIHFDRRRVEYSIDDEDMQWLADQRIPETELDEEAMELLLDVLEKESFRQLEFRQINARVVPVEPVEEKLDEDDEPCSACGGKDWDEENLILFCDGCNMPIHQACQDLSSVPDDDWYCDTCVYRMGLLKQPAKNSIVKRNAGASSSQKQTPFIDFSIQIPCIICNMVDGGPMKKTHLPGRFAHLVCSLMHPDVWFENDQANVSRVISGRNKNTPCSVCGHPGGLVKCSQRGCNVQYHVMCARENGQQLMFNVPDPEEEEELEKAELQEALAQAAHDDHEASHAHTHHTHHHAKAKSAKGGGEDMDVDIDDFSEDTNPLNSLNTSTTSMVSEKEKDVKKKRKKKTQKKKTPHQPYQSLCALHSGAIRAEKLEQARMASLAIPVDVGRFLKEEDEQHPMDIVAGDTTTFSKAADVLKKVHSMPSGFILKKETFERVVAYWKAKRLARRLGHMPFIFQLHVLVTHFKEDFDAGRKLESEPRQVEKLIAQYTPQKKFEILKQLRDSVEILRTTLDLVKKREVKKRLALLERLNIFDEVMKSENKPAAIRAIFSPANRVQGVRSSPFSMGPSRGLTIKLPVSAIKRVLQQRPSTSNLALGPVMTSVTTASRSNGIASPPPKKKVAPLPKINNSTSTTASSPSPKKLPTSPKKHALIPVSKDEQLENVLHNRESMNTAVQTSTLLVSPVPVLAQPSPASQQSQIIVPQTIVAPPISSLPKRSPSPAAVKMAAIPASRSSPSPQPLPMVNSMVTSVPPLTRPIVPPPSSPSPTKIGGKITSFFNASGVASSPFAASKPSTSPVPSTSTDFNAMPHVYAPATPPRSSIPSGLPTHPTYRNDAGLVANSQNNEFNVVNHNDNSMNLDSSRMDVSIASEHVHSMSTLSSPMATPTKLSHVKMPLSPPVPLATSSPKAMTPISSPKPIRAPIVIESDPYDEYGSAMEEDNILFHSDGPRSSIFDSPRRAVSNATSKVSGAMQM